jgi:outer membrane protein OmpA-like peptidoglycan-associated protein
VSFRSIISALAAAFCLVASHEVQAQKGFDTREPRITYSPIRVRTSLLGAMLVSKDQTGALGYDGFGVLLDASLGYEVMPWLEPRLSLLGGSFPSQVGGAGGLISPLFGVSLGTPNPARHLYVYAELGPGFSGSLVRIFVRVGVGIDFRVLPWLSLGPTFGYAQLFQDNDPNSTTDARMLVFGLSATFRPARVEPPRPRNFTKTRYVREVEVVRMPPEPPDEDVMHLLDAALPASRVELLAPVLFKFDSEELEPVGVAMLHEVAAELARRPDIELLEIQGYADQRGSAEYNAELSLRRAQRVKEWLVAHGVAEERLQVAARGATNPVEPGATETEYEQNRRVVFRVLRAKAP